ncbi:MAG TPA: AraC family transcriptional regulator [Caulobacteraceae bacterium]|jgi:AraC-like DNA-binding protein
MSALEIHDQAGNCEPSATLCANGLRRGRIAATRVLIDEPPGCWPPPPPSQDAFLLRLHLRDYPAYRCREAQAPATVSDMRAGETVFHDLRRQPRLMIDKPLHAIEVQISNAAIETLAEDAGALWRGELDYAPGRAVADPTILNLCRSVLPEFEDGRSSGSLLFDHVSRALATHVAEAYGGLHRIPRVARGGLAAWQLRRAKELLAANLDRAVAVADLARECQLSVSHFSRAFHQSTGFPPHGWLRSLRVEVAKDLLREREASLADIAQRCGFCDQSHFTRVFAQQMGVSPGAWRRGLAL